MTELFTDNPNLRYFKEDNRFSGYASDLDCGYPDREVKISNPKTGNHKIFMLKKVDTDATGEDIYGWNFATKCGIKLLIIND